MTDENTPESPPEIPVEVVGEATTPVPAAEGAAELQAAKEKLQQLEQEKKELHERLLRTAADFDNFRKRSRKDADEARFKAREEVLKELLPVLDNLERAVAAGTQGPGIVEGVKLVLRQAENAMERFEVKSFPALGQPFDPARHEAIAQVESADHAPGTVVSEMQRGYMLGNRLLRPAMVAVSRAKAPPPEPPAANGEDKGEPPPEERTEPGSPPGEGNQ
jgi:molecular chaperone GrpE